MTPSHSLVRIALKIRTPLLLAGLIVVILYFIYKSILSLPVFDKVGAESTARIIESILSKLFWLALISVILGVLSYLLVRFKPAKQTSSVALIDASLDAHKSGYTQEQHGLVKRITPQKEGSPQWSRSKKSKGGDIR